MSITSDLLKAHRVGVRELKEHLSKKFLKKPLIITSRGNPISVNLPYQDVIELVDILDEVSDAETVETVQEGRKAIKKGKKGIPASNLLNKFKKDK